MKKKRIIFKLIFSDGYFCVSRNFKLQKVGNVKWLFDKLKFDNIANHIDELVIINASPSNFKDPISKKFKASITQLMRKTFVPLTIGGGLRNLSQVLECFKIGADKIVLNSAIADNSSFVKNCVNKFGSQAIIAGVDFKIQESKYYSYINNGQKKYLELNKHFKIIKKLKYGEVFLTSIDKDGTGFGFEKDVLKNYNLKMPLVLSGGAGNAEHFLDIIFNDDLSGLMTGNLFNFLGNGLIELRRKLLKDSVKLRII
tara:strand:- start:2333 stop:3100 length:768 start_codon:yes stop_codon:yes gene_type:complete